MRRVSNIAYNREFAQRTGIQHFHSGDRLILRRDRENPYDSDAVGVWLSSCSGVPFGWLYRKDNNRAEVLSALDRGVEIAGHLEFQDRHTVSQKTIVFWL
jgi:hypothetical protein